MSASHPRAGDLPRGNALLSNRLKEAARELLAPLVRLAQRLGITPNRVTIAGFIVVVAAAGVVAAGGLLVGALFGSFLDSTLDRASEGILYVGIVAYFLRTSADPLWPVLLALAALSGSFMVSYTRARAEALGIPASVGLAPRTERMVLVVAGIGLAGLGWEIGLTGAIGIIAALAAATTVQRIWHVRRQIEASSSPSGIGGTAQER
jgi:CDP-diacylglycerol--glycerol-3-phosphate 3-phosphatidyltransferase